MRAGCFMLPAEPPRGPKCLSLLVKLTKTKSWEIINFQKNQQLLERTGKDVRAPLLVVSNCTKYQDGLRTWNWRRNIFPCMDLLRHL